MRECLICKSNDVVTPLLGMFGLALCPEHRATVQDAHRPLRDAAQATGRPAPLLDENFAIKACMGSR